jgi:hypothetical protein
MLNEKMAREVSLRSTSGYHHPSGMELVPNHPKTGLATGPEQVFSGKVQRPIHQWIRRSQMNLEPILE